MQLERLGILKKSNDLIGIRTRDLPACSTVPQPTTVPRAPLIYTLYKALELQHTQNFLLFCHH
jgi:hypothetical protein